MEAVYLDGVEEPMEIQDKVAAIIQTVQMQVPFAIKAVAILGYN